MKSICYIFTVLILFNLNGCATMQLILPGKKKVQKREAYLQKIFDEKESDDWRNAYLSYTIESFTKYLKKYPSAGHSERAKNLIEEIKSWNNTETANTLEAYNTYLMQYPEGEHVKKAKEIADQMTWQSVRQRNTIESYTDYLNTFPDGQYLAEANNIMESMIGGKSESINTPEAHTDYLNKLPEGKYPDLDENKTWETAVFSNDYNSYSRYLGLFPGGIYSEEAKRKMEKLLQSASVNENEEITDIIMNGFTDHFFIREIIPAENDLPCRVTLKPVPEGTKEFQASIIDFVKDNQGYSAGMWMKGPSLCSYGFLIDTEFPNDKYCVPVSKDGLNSAYIKGEGSVHRFEGKIVFDNYTFIGEGDISDRLTFILLKEGYVYVRGKGTITDPEGKQMRFGYE
jgi:hypothetical protein